LRFPEDLEELLDKSAAENERSFTQEVTYQLRRALKVPAMASKEQA
jgi:hypothetical protein